MTGDAEAFERCMAVGGLALFPADTVYGLACDASNKEAVERLYLLKRRPLDKPSAVMFFDRSLSLDALPELGPRTQQAALRLLPGAVTLLLPNPQRRFALACGSDPLTLGLRVPIVPLLDGVRWPVLQSSANLAGGQEATRLSDVPELIRAAADLVIDGGQLPGVASTVVDLRRYESEGSWSIVREGAVPTAEVGEALCGQFHFDPATYAEMIREDIPLFDRLQDELVAISGSGAQRILELGTGTGETAGRLLARHRSARLLGIDASEAMLSAARDALPADRVELRVARLEEQLPAGSFDLVASALCVHHLPGSEKADLFARVRAALAPGGLFALADVVVPEDPADAVTSLTEGYDHPSSVADQLRWLQQAGFEPEVRWTFRDLAVIAARIDR